MYSRARDVAELESCADALDNDNGKSLALLLDGYDEFPKSLREDSLVADILDRSILPECGVIISSRPHVSVRLRSKAHLRAEILGFTIEEQEHFIQQSLKVQPLKIQDLTSYLRNHMAIQSLCYTPFNMMVLLFLYKQGIPLPDNPTDLYKQFIAMTLCRHLSKLSIPLDLIRADIQDLPNPFGKIIQQLSWLSLDKLNNNQLTFTLDEIKSYCPQLETVPGAINGFGLLQAVDHIGLYKTIKTFNFVHFSVQEFLAANRMLCLSPQDEYKVLEDYFWSDFHHNMFNFYVSLTKGQRPMFKQYLSNGSVAAIPIADKFLKNKMKRLRLYHCFYKAQDKKMCRAIEDTFSDQKIKFPLPLSPNDLLDVTTMLTCSSIKQWRMLEFGNCRIQDFGVQLLHRSLINGGIIIYELRLYNNDISSSSDGFLTDIALNCKVKTLSIGQNKAVGESEHFMVLSKPSTELEVLHMDGNNYSSAKWAEQIFALLMTNKSLKKLWIDNNNINDEMSILVTKALQVNKTLCELYMGNNPITGEAAQNLIKSLSDNNTLQVLRLPKYPESVTEVITELEDFVNANRKEKSCEEKLKINFSQF